MVDRRSMLDSIRGWELLVPKHFSAVRRCSGSLADDPKLLLVLRLVFFAPSRLWSYDLTLACFTISRIAIITYSSTHTIVVADSDGILVRTVAAHTDIPTAIITGDVLTRCFYSSIDPLVSIFLSSRMPLILRCLPSLHNGKTQAPV